MALIELAMPILLGNVNYNAGDVVDVDETLLADLKRSGAIAPSSSVPVADAPAGTAAAGATSSAPSTPESDLELLNLDADVANVLIFNKVYTIEQLRTVPDLLALRGVGKSTAKSIAAALESYSPSAEPPAE